MSACQPNFNVSPVSTDLILQNLTQNLYLEIFELSGVVAEALSLEEVLDRPATVAESLLFPFDGGVRPLKPAFAPTQANVVGDTGSGQQT